MKICHMHVEKRVKTKRKDEDMTLRNVEQRPKNEKKKHEQKEIHERSSDLTVYNVYEQDWSTLLEEGLSHYFDDQADFERRKKEKKNEKGKEWS